MRADRKLSSETGTILWLAGPQCDTRHRKPRPGLILHCKSRFDL